MNNKVVLKEDFFFHIQYHKGDIFYIIGSDPIRGWDIKHEKTGRIIYECGFIQNKFEKYGIKQERKEKINKLNE